MREAALLAEVWRGDAPEAVVRGHIAVVDGDGRLLAAAGDPATVTTVRSTVKPLQALAYLGSGAHDALGAGEDELALACASHQGEPVHIATARRLLGRAGQDESALRCGPQWPASDEAARALAAAGGVAGRIHNNCSGKHSAMVATCVHSGWPLATYPDRAHPLQQTIAARIGAYAGVDVDTLPHGIDGCGLPTAGMPLTMLAATFARAATRDSDFRRCQAAMAAHPHLVGGTGRFDSALLAAHGGDLTCKIGGAAVWVAVRRDGSRALALKLEAGAGEWVAPVGVAALQAAEMLATPAPAVAALATGVVRNWEGSVVGGTRVRVDLRPA